MDDADWQRFFVACAEQLGPGSMIAATSSSWCSYTTFQRLTDDAGYWTMGLPAVDEVKPWGISEGGTWGQSFRFGQLAHVIIPREFYWDQGQGAAWECGHRAQDLTALSAALSLAGVEHRLADLVLEIKIF